MARRQASAAVARTRSTALRRSEERLRLATEASGIYSWEIDLRAQTVTYSDNVSDVTGRHPRDLAEAADTVHPNDRGLILTAFDQALASGHHIDYQVRALAPGNVYGWYHVTGIVLRDRAGAPLRAVGISQNVTAAKRAELALREREERLRFLVESVKDYAIYTVDPEGFVTSWNDGAIQMSGHTSNDVLGQPMAAFYRPHEVAAGAPQNDLRRAMATGRSEQECWRVRRDGTLLWVNEIITPLRAGGGRHLGFTVISRDLTERKRLEDALRQAYELLEQRVRERTGELGRVNVALSAENRERRAGEAAIKALFERLVSVQEEERRHIARELHDHLGQQLTALRMHIEAIRMSSVGDASLARQLEKTQQLAEELDRSIDFLTSNLRPSVLDHVGLPASLDSLVSAWSDRFGLDASFQSTGLTTPQLDEGIASNLYRITQEALHNIVKHAHAKSTSVMLEHGEHELTLTIADDGCGFDVTDDRERPAPGLGLVNMRERAFLAGGLIDLDTAPGRGTTIVVRVPIKKASPPA